MTLRRLAGHIAAAIVLLQMSLPVEAKTIDLSRMAVTPNARLGIAFPGDKTQYYPLIAQAGIGIARISVQWKLVEPTPGRFNWSGLDRRVAALQALGIHPFLTFESNADWATVAETRGVKNARPRDPAQWQRFVNAVVERYDGDGRNDMRGLRRPVPYWQAANEWISDRNKSGGWVGSADQLIAYIKLT
ncbi:MAG: beta-galactosidase, partial [Sulfitobacter sp.]|nr:beta-galactosidase [Sulfitobacter sp.]